MIRVIYPGPADFAAPFRYVVRHLFRIMGYKYSEGSAEGLDNVQAVLSYGAIRPDTTPEIPWLTIGAVADYQKTKQAASLQRAFLNVDDRADFPIQINALFDCDMPELQRAVYINQSGEPVISRSQFDFVCRFDLIATCFYILTLEQERRTNKRDEYGRFQQVHCPLDNSIYDFPVIDRIARVIRALLSSRLSGKMNALSGIWPDKKRFAVALSHDVDRIRTWTFRKARRTLAPVIRTRPWSGLFYSAGYMFHLFVCPENWLFNFKTITQMEKKFSAASTFFFVQQRRTRIDPGYSLYSTRLRRGISIVKKAGSAIGLHGTITAGRNAGQLQEEREGLEKAIGRTVSGCRQHYLIFDPDKTWAAMQKAGFRFDSTLGFADAAGYRCGTGFPFHPWDPQEQKEMKLLEIPLVLMDTVLFLESKQGLTAANSRPLVYRLLDETRDNAACLTVNWHNSDLFANDLSGFSDLYQSILEWTIEHNGWLCTLDELHNWWRLL